MSTSPDRAYLERRARLARSFSPSTPINDHDLFSGRTDQLFRLLDVVQGRGQHAVVYGERGVGKTSIAAVVAAVVRVQGLIAVRVNCDGSDDFASLWRKVADELLSELRLVSQGTDVELLDRAVTMATDILLDPALRVGDVKVALQTLANVIPVVIVLDEFDRLLDEATQTALADLVKALSDYAIAATLVFVGVADDVDGLIHAHESINRALVQVHMPRMSDEELEEILVRGTDVADMTMTAQSARHVVGLSRGLPHYTHLVGLKAALRALDAASTVVDADHVASAVDQALRDAQQTVVRLYLEATSSPQANNLYPQVLLACVLAETDERAYFAPADLRRPLSSVLGRTVDIPTFAKHLNALSSQRGPVLQRIGGERRYRYRLLEPLLGPYVILAALRRGDITLDRLADM